MCIWSTFKASKWTIALVYSRIHEQETTMSQTEMYTLESICVCIHICATCTHVKQQHVACALNTHEVYEQVCLHMLKYVSSYHSSIRHNSVWYLRAIGSSEALDLYLCGQTSGQGSLPMLVLVCWTASSGQNRKKAYLQGTRGTASLQKKNKIKRIRGRCHNSCGTGSRHVMSWFME